MSNRPNILFLMTDQMQGRVLDPKHPCITPNFDKLAARGVRITRAYTPNAVCSPARASLMTGLLPHTHGVFSVTHCCHEYHCDIQPDKPHFAQALAEAGYHNSYFGKWHVERTEKPGNFGWHVDGGTHQLLYGDAARAAKQDRPFVSKRMIQGIEGYEPSVLYGVVDAPAESRMLGVTTQLAFEQLQKNLQSDQPWCSFVSVIEPHDPFICSKQTYDMYDPASFELPENIFDDLEGRPNVYRKVAKVFASLTEQEKREAMACYYAMVTEIDQQFGRLLDLLESSGQLENTIVVLTSDHGEMLGSHQLYMKNYGAWEEIYNIPMVVAGPGVAEGNTCGARVGLHDLAPTLCELGGANWADTGESRSFVDVLRDPAANADRFTTGYAEYFGTRYWLTQRVIWDGDWKLVWNGFDFDELYNLADDPCEMRNRIDDPDCDSVVRKLMQQAWRIVNETNDHPLGGSRYPVLRAAPYGPAVVF